MAVRGVFQLRNVKLQFCDFGGSSRGVRDLLKTSGIETFLDRNPQIKLEAYMNRGSHPYIKTEYANGWVRTISLRNLSQESVSQVLEDARSAIGHRAWKHAGPKVYSLRPSIQGKWRPNMWGNTASVEEFAPRALPQPPVNRTTSPRKPRRASRSSEAKFQAFLNRQYLI